MSHLAEHALRACFFSRRGTCAELDKGRPRGRAVQDRPGSGPCSASNAAWTAAKRSSARSSVAWSCVAITLVRSSAPAGGTAGWIATLT